VDLGVVELQQDQQAVQVGPQLLVKAMLAVMALQTEQPIEMVVVVAELEQLVWLAVQLALLPETVVTEQQAQLAVLQLLMLVVVVVVEVQIEVVEVQVEAVLAE
jgi:hypothetical protein